ncbi:peptidoglycan-binding protein [Streptomyces sp. ISL-11]|uniref:peptidoglycan-binding domain-containing protein n=1 Tax=Streptomyces sp. ISL-11 TaxID=2819174 RepID=UPI001BE9D721|nr:peptidoglycan-binding protein [Streptomyces sp. ISL-11]MBT2387694.1 peptidoglycan-binding protein [Streptomyces sp. ISL-11]
MRPVHPTGAAVRIRRRTHIGAREYPVAGTAAPKRQSRRQGGILGPETAKAIMNYQRAEGLVVDGIAGRMTKAALTAGGSLPTPRPFVVQRPAAGKPTPPSLYDKAKDGACGALGEGTGALAGTAVGVATAETGPGAVVAGAIVDFGTKSFITNGCKWALAIDAAH